MLEATITMMTLFFFLQSSPESIFFENIDFLTSVVSILVFLRRRLKRSEQGLLAGTHHLEVDPLLTSKQDGDGKEGNIKIVADARPPRKGRRRSEHDTESHKVVLPDCFTTSVFEIYFIKFVCCFYRFLL